MKKVLFAPQWFFDFGTTFMYENSCGNCVGEVELTFDFFLYIDLTIFKILRL
jgi:hypothetical protein